MVKAGTTQGYKGPNQRTDKGCLARSGISTQEEYLFALSGQKEICPHADHLRLLSRGFESKFVEDKGLQFVFYRHSLYLKKLKITFYYKN